MRALVALVVVIMVAHSAAQGGPVAFQPFGAGGTVMEIAYLEDSSTASPRHICLCITAALFSTRLYTASPCCFSISFSLFTHSSRALTVSLRRLHLYRGPELVLRRGCDNV